MPIHESGEDYLEAILRLQEKGKSVRGIDIVTHLGYSKPSVSVAMKKLRQDGYIQVDPGGIISLTPAGRAVAMRTWERHRLLTGFFVALGVEPEVAERDACKVEHDLSQETFEKLLEHVKSKSQE